MNWGYTTSESEERGEGYGRAAVGGITHTGDYHDNMCSDMFMKWVEEKLVPTFDKKYPGEK